MRIEILGAFMSESDDTSVDIKIGDTFYILWNSGDLESFVRNDDTIHGFIVPNVSNIVGWWKDEDKAIQKAIEHKHGNTSN